MKQKSDLVTLDLFHFYFFHQDFVFFLSFKVCIVMTDGRSYDSVVGPGRFLQRKRIQCYAVGIGRNYNRKQLLQITAGNRRRVVTASFRNLQSVVRTISRGVCGGTAIVTKRWRMVETRLVQPPNLPLLTFC